MLNGLILLGLLVCCGFGCARNRQLVNDYAPTVLSGQPTLEELIRVVNGNSARIQQLQSDGATLDLDGMPALEANYAVERPRRFRLRAEAGLYGPVLDLGSNEQVYWMWARHSDEPGVFWGRHDEFSESVAQQMLPVPPDWMIEALGVVRLDPTGHHEGPRLNADGQLEIYSHVQTANGPIQKLTVVDPTRGWVLRQHLYDSQQRPIASAVAGQFAYDELTGVSLPRQVEIHLPPIQLSFTLNTERHIINSLTGDPQQLWSVPQISDAPLVNLADPSLTQRLVPTLMASRPSRMANRRAAREPQRRDTAVRRSGLFSRLK